MSQDAKDSLMLVAGVTALAAFFGVLWWLQNHFGTPHWLVAFMHSPWRWAAEAVMLGSTVLGWLRLRRARGDAAERREG